MSSTRFIPACLGVALLASWPTACLAGDTTLKLNATVTRNCTVAALPLMFGTVADNVTVTAQTRVFVNCTPGTPYTVTMDNGLWVKSGQRRMSNPGAKGVREYLDYDIYRNAARTQRWGGTPATGVSGVTGAAQVTLIAYGSALGKKVSAGAYTDTVVVTLTF